jgi:signal transduction histidine kinase
MLLLYLVLIIFWQRDALQREIALNLIVLDRIADRLPGDIIELQKISSDYFSMEDFYSSGQNGKILVYIDSHAPVETKSSYVPLPLMLRTLKEAKEKRKTVTHYSGSLFGLVGFHRNVLVVADPVFRQGRCVGAVGIERTFESMFQTLWQAERLIWVYIFINLIILGVIGFFRMTKLVVRPIERLVQLADQYDDDRLLFAVGNSGSEFARLAMSLNSMLTRIEQDRKSLKKTVAELEEANQQLKKNQQEMIRTEKLASVGRMATGLAHEIGNPLGIIQGYIGLLESSGEQSNENLDFLKRANEELQRVSLLIGQLLDFSRISKGCPQYVSLHELIVSVVEMVTVQPVFNNIEVVSTLEATHATLFVDQERLRQVLVNCLINSADSIVASTHRNDGKIIMLTSDQPGMSADDETACIRLQIIDNGGGVQVKKLADVFDPFFTTKEPGKGTGLGLSVSMAIVEKMGGSIRITNNEEHGATVIIDLPCLESEVSHPLV